jgi:ATP phosphoribosyltransferase
MLASSPDGMRKVADDLEGKLLFAIPKKGRLYDKCTKLLEDIGLKYRRKNRLDVAVCTNQNIAIVFLPAADIALFVANGRVDLGITGQDIIAESADGKCAEGEEKGIVTEELQLGFGGCKLCVQAPVTSGYTDATQLVGKRIVTSFTHLTSEYFKKLDPSQVTPVTYISGSVEVACSLGLADAVVDLVESGDSMHAAGLEAIDTIMRTEAVLLSNPNSTHKDMIDKIKNRMDGVITAQKYVYLMYNIERAKLAQATEITPGMTGPTVTSLEDETFCAVSVMCLRSEVHDKMDDLQDLGATDIIIQNIANCRKTAH